MFDVLVFAYLYVCVHREIKCEIPWHGPDKYNVDIIGHWKVVTLKEYDDMIINGLQITLTLPVIA